MGQLKLPPELATKKVKSLSGQSAKLVEELLKEKFDLKEEVREQSRDPFQGYSGDFGTMGPLGFTTGLAQEIGRTNAIQRESAHTHSQQYPGRGIEVQYNPYTGGRLVRAFIGSHGNAETGIEEAMHLLDMKNIDYNGRKIHVHARRMHFLLRDGRVPMGHNVRTKVRALYGCEIVVVPEHFQEMIEVNY